MCCLLRRKNQGCFVVPSNSQKIKFIKGVVLSGFLLSGEYVLAQDDDMGAVNLNKVMIHGAGSDEQIEQSGFEVDVIEVGEYKNFSADINQIISSSPGVIIRESGGLGSSFKLSLNGLSENQIRYFIDGIPMESFGSALSLNNFPANLIRRIELYKGVAPISLGADALGGAISLTTPDLTEELFDVSYSLGSFNTHKTALFTQASNDQGHFLRISSFLNHSDNDYWMDDVVNTDEFGNVLGTKRAKRFHDQYTSGMFNLKTGIAGTKLADELSVSATYAENNNNYQHPDKSANELFGDYHTRNNTKLVSVIYKKIFDGMKVTAYALGGEITETTYDTSSKEYDWNGDYTNSSDVNEGEFDTKSIFERKDKVTRGSLSGDYSINEVSNLSANISTNYLKRSGSDEVNKANVHFAAPNWEKKAVLGVSYGLKPLDSIFSGTMFAKQYWYEGQISADLYDDLEENVIVEKGVDMSATGFGFTSRYLVLDNAQLKLSFERAYRLPEADEILGSGTFIYPNPELQKEKSDNLNLGFLVSSGVDGWYIKSDTNIFYRKAEDFISYVARQVVRGSYENTDSVKVQGLETSFSLLFNEKYSVVFNGTYQDMTDQTKFNETGQKNSGLGERMPNEPYLFGNIKAGFVFNTPAYDRVSTSWTINYVKEYFLYRQDLGDPDTKNTIPSQTTHDFNADYSFGTGKYNVSFTASNIFDTAAFDNFSIQKPGRAYYLKFRYFN